MKVFYIDIKKSKQTVGKEILCQYADIELKTEKRFFEYTLGRYLIKTVAEKYYNVKDTEIIIKENGKPEFKSGGIYFSISHSENLLAVCFDEYPCGIDIEFMKDRNWKDISKYYGQEFKTLEDFYKFWTKQEAEYKLGEKAKYCKSLSIKNYYFTVVSNKIFHSLFFEKFVD